MERSYGVVWREGKRQSVSGKLELLSAGNAARGAGQLEGDPVQRSDRRASVVVPLKPGAREAVRAILNEGPPFDPASIDGLERHEVFLTDSEAVFVFEAHASADDLAPLLSEPKLWEAVAAWREHVAGPPRIAEDVFSWARGEPPEDVSFLPTPGPGNSDGGDVF